MSDNMSVANVSHCGIFARCITEKRIANHIRVDHVHQSEPLERVMLMQATSHMRVSTVSCELDRTAGYSEDLQW